MFKYYIVYSDHSGNIHYMVTELEECDNIENEIKVFPFIAIIFYYEKYNLCSNFHLNIEKFKERYEVIGLGQQRIVFKLSDDYVIKLPLSPKGIVDNKNESNYKLNNPNSKIKTASCEMISIDGIECLKMESVEHWSALYTSSGELDDWCLDVDCCQVGFNKKGDLVAYDFA